MEECELSCRIISKLPYSRPFLFVDRILSVDDDAIEGLYYFREDEFFYTGHFVNRPVTPGVILVECMGQIGLVSHAIFLEKLYLSHDSLEIHLCDFKAEFFRTVTPNTNVLVRGRVMFMRAGKLRSEIQMIEEKSEDLIAVIEGSCIIRKDG